MNPHAARTALAVIALAALGTAPRIADGQAYVVTPITQYCDFSSFTRYGINKDGHVSGWMRMPDGTIGAFRWDPSDSNATAGQLTPLASGSSNPAAGYGINDLGDVVGVSVPPTYLSHALLWPFGGRMQDLAGGGATQAEAWAINSNRDIAIYCYNGKNTANNGANVSRLVNGKRKLLYVGPGGPIDINNAGQVLTLGGVLYTPSGASTWKPRQIVGGPGIGLAYSLNELGDVVGDNYSHPFLYLSTDLTGLYGLPSGMNDLWSLITPVLPEPLPGSTWYCGGALAVNDNRVVVGTAGAGYYSNDVWTQTDVVVWIWDSANGARLLQNLLVTPGWTLTAHNTNFQINSMGQIVATATNGTADHCVLLTPTP